MNTKMLAVTLVALCATGAFGEVKNKQLTPEQKAAVRERMMQTTGGIIKVPGQGQLVVVNGQSRVPESVLATQMNLIAKSLKVNVSARGGEYGQDKVGKDFDAYKASALVYVVDLPALPRVLLAIDDKWGVVNVKALAADNPSKEVLEARVSKSLVRTMALVLGATTSRAKVSVLQSAPTLDELDKIENMAITSDAMMNILTSLPKLGITQEKITTYKRACQQGWAPSPTNDAQKAIWDSVHAMPKNPMKIEFDPKKGR